MISRLLVSQSIKESSRYSFSNAINIDFRSLGVLALDLNMVMASSTSDVQKGSAENMQLASTASSNPMMSKNFHAASQAILDSLLCSRSDGR
jgi:hypothetical protein